MITRRFIETLAMLMIGDSMLAILSPSRHLSLWLSGPKWWQRLWAPLVQRPAAVRAAGFIGLGLGILLAWREEPPAPAASARNGRQWATRLVEALR